MNKLQPIQQNGERVLTTAKIAEAFETEPKIINRNFQRNSERYVHGKHYFALTGDELRDFKGSRQIDDSLKYTSVLYLWTERGAWLLAKSINTNKAWEAYEMLVDEYYRMKDEVVPLSKEQALVTVLRTTADLVEGHQEIVKEQHELRKLVSKIDEKVEEQITLNSGEQRGFQKAVSRRVYEFTKDKAEASKLFRELYREIKDRFGIPSYKDLRRNELQSALNYVNNWIPKRVA